MPELERFSAKTELDWERVWEAFDRDGGLIVEDFVAPDLLGRLQREVAPLVMSPALLTNSEGVVLSPKV